MADSSDDPWEWDNDRIVRELCTEHRTWEPPDFPPRLPPLDQLERNLRDHEVDGRSFLGQAFQELDFFNDLGVKAIKHKETIRSAVAQWRRKSRIYKLYKIRHGADDSEDAGYYIVADKLNPASRKRKLETEQRAASDGPAYADPQPMNRETPSVTAKETVLPDPPSVAAPPSLPSAATLVSAEVKTSATPAEPAHKKRRLAPTHLSAEQSSAVVRNIPSGSLVSDFVPAELPGSYLGAHVFNRADILEFTDLSEPLDDEERTFVFLAEPEPYGRRRKRNRLLKRHLARGWGPSHRPAKPDMVPGGNDPEHYDVLPAYGDSDDEYDSDTWNEIQKDNQEEQERRGKASSKGLTEDQKHSLLDQYITERQQLWDESKLPDLQYKANRIWSKARKQGLRYAIRQQVLQRQRLEDRLAKYRSNIIQQQYSNKAEMIKGIGILEPTVDNIQHCSWMLDVIKRRSQPEKLPRARHQAKPRKARVVAEDDEEILSSSSDSGDYAPDEYIGDEGMPEDELMLDGDEPMLDADDGPPPLVGLEEVNLDRREPSVVATDGEVKTQFKSMANAATPSVSEFMSDSETGTPEVRATTSSKKPLAHLRDDLPVQTPSGQPRFLEDPKDMIDLTCIDSPIKTEMEPLGSQETPTRQKSVIDLITPPNPRRSSSTDHSHGPLSGGPGSRETTVDDAGAATESTMIDPDAIESEFDEIDDEIDDENDDEDDDENVIMRSTKDKGKGKVKVIQRDQAAQDLRESEKMRIQEQAERRKAVRTKLALMEGTAAGQKSRFIVNDSKKDDQAFIYVPDNIAMFIKDHQIAGVRFMWNQLISDAQDGRGKKQGCLLAHTMGLGKTMQVIALLATIAEASSSEDPAIFEQIPSRLRTSKTLILCPPGLVNNWMDELLLWTEGPNHCLGQFYKIDSVLNDQQREQTLHKWAAEGGVMIVGYKLFTSLVTNKETSPWILESPNLVVADEAHALKRSKTKIHINAAMIKTHARIALTGSPLANNVLEYHAMINWVAPNYLSNSKEFSALYANPIEQGLGRDSTAAARRKALIRMRSLKETVAPKVHRRTIHSLKDELPQKVEFVITVPLTEMQQAAYETFVSGLGEREQTGVLALTQVMALLCNHPACFRTRLTQQKKGEEVDTLTKNAAVSSQTVSDVLRQIPLGSVSGTSGEKHSWKVVLLMHVLEESRKQGDSVLIFSQSIPTLDYLEQALRRRGFPQSRLDGKTDTNLRHAMVRDFNATDFCVFLISTTAGGVGLNIVGANRVVIFDARFNPQHEQQAIGRAYRLGQKKPVFVYRFICAESFEMQMQERGIFKTQLASRVVDQKNPIPKAQVFNSAVFRKPGKPQRHDLKPFRGRDKVLDTILGSDLAQGVCSITTADTFEEEDLDDEKLTPEEQEQARLMIEAHNARFFALAQANAYGPQPGALTQTDAAPTPTTSGALAPAAASADTPADSSMTPSPATTTPPNPTRVPAQAPTAGPAPAAMPVTPAAAPAGNPQVTPATLLPILGATTQFRPPPPSPQTSSTATPVPAAAQGQPEDQPTTPADVGTPVSYRGCHFFLP